MVVRERSLRSDLHFPNGQLRVVGGVSGGHRARLAERHFLNFLLRVVGGD